MQLHVARLCLDCQDVHDERACPKCSSQSFVLLSKWVPAPERRARPRTAEDVETYRQLLAPDPPASSSSGWVKGGAFVAAVTLGGWLWRRTLKSAASPERSADER